MRRSIAALLAFVAVVFTVALAQEPVTLKYVFKKGETRYQKMVLEVTGEMVQAGQDTGMPLNMSMSFVLGTTTTGVKSNGNAQMTAELSSVKMTMNGQDVGSMMGEMKMPKTKVEIDPLGASVGTPIVSGGAEMGMDPNMLLNGMPILFVVFPSTPLKPGDTWTIVKDFEMPMMPGAAAGKTKPKMTIVYTYAGQEEFKGSPAYRIRAEMNSSFDVPIGDTGRATGTTKGVTTFLLDISTLDVRLGEGDLESKMQMKTGGEGGMIGDMKIDTTTKQTIFRTTAPPKLPAKPVKKPSAKPVRKR